jgi:AcrR family transcriptional regulator
VATTKERILETTAELFRRYGYTGTGLKQIVTEANAPFGSLYHFFPGGKEQLGGEVILRSGQMYADLVEAFFDAAPDPATGAHDVFAAAAEVLRQTDYADACPIATVALEVANTNEPLRQATAEVFDSWIERGTGKLTDAGIDPTRGRELATMLIALLEGSFVLCRALRTTEPLAIAGTAARAAIQEALRSPRARRRPSPA